MISTLRSELSRYLRTETVGGSILLIAAALALIWVNSPFGESYIALRDFQIGPSALHLDLSLGTWAQDGLLAVFFFVAGLELKRELVVGELADRKAAMLPIIAACGGVLVPAIIAASIGFGTPGMDKGWAIPVATDIAFALGVLALTGSKIPASARVFLLSLAVVDDLLAIILIAVLFTGSLAMLWLLTAAAALAAYAYAQHKRITTPFLYVPLALLTWYAMHEAGIHATLAGVALGLLTRVRRDPDEEYAPGSRLEHRIQPYSAGFCVPRLRTVRLRCSDQRGGARRHFHRPRRAIGCRRSSGRQNRRNLRNFPARDQIGDSNQTQDTGIERHVCPLSSRWHRVHR